MDSDFVCERRVGFGDCDPALIAYTGKIADFALEALDRFWETILDGEGWFQMNVDKGYGMPFVRMEYDFHHPIRPGPPLVLRVRPVKLGTTSICMMVEGEQRGTGCFTARFVSVFVDRNRKTKITIPPHIRAVMTARWPDCADAAGEAATPAPPAAAP